MLVFRYFIFLSVQKFVNLLNPFVYGLVATQGSDPGRMCLVPTQGSDQGGWAWCQTKAVTRAVLVPT